MPQFDLIFFMLLIIYVLLIATTKKKPPKLRLKNSLALNSFGEFVILTSNGLVVYRDIGIVSRLCVFSAYKCENWE